MANYQQQQQQQQKQQLQEPTTWPDFAASLYDRLTGRGAQITYEFEDFDLFIPTKVGPQPTHAHWKMRGTINIRTTDPIHQQPGTGSS